MCGIAGIVRSTRATWWTRPRLKRMRDVLRHRGPDGEGLLASTARSASPTAASPSSTSPAAQQPMPNEDGTRLDHLQRRDLQPRRRSGPASRRRGHRYRTRSDTETILHLYEEEGDALRRAAAGHVRVRDLGPAARAPAAGARSPRHQAALLRGDRARAAVRLGDQGDPRGRPGAPALNAAAVPEFLATRYVAGEETFFQGIRKLPPGHTFAWSRAGGPQRRRYWRLPVDADESSAGPSRSGRPTCGRASRRPSAAT